MWKLIAVWILVALSVGACVNYDPWGRPEPSAFDLVCSQVEAVYPEASCRNLAPPEIIITDIVREMGAIGVYMRDEDHIFIARNLTIEKTYMIIFHETIHYVLWELDLVNNRCKSEALARQWTADILDVPIDPTWRTRYRCTNEGLL